MKEVDIKELRDYKEYLCIFCLYLKGFFILFISIRVSTIRLTFNRVILCLFINNLGLPEESFERPTRFHFMHATP